MKNKLLLSHDLSDQEIESMAEVLLDDGGSTEETSAELLCHAAFVLFRYGVAKQKGRPLLLALDKLMHAEEIDSPFFEQSVTWRHLWGNILVHLSRLVHDYSFVEKALEQYAQAAQIGDQNSGLLWDWAQAWVLLGVQSTESADLKQGLDKFEAAQELGCDSPLFRIDHSIAYMICGTHTGDSSYLEEALSHLQGVIADTYDVDGAVSPMHARAWTTYAIVCKQCYTLTHAQEDFDRADKALREAILSVPSQADLWLEWGELCLYAGWLRRDLSLIEAAIDKLTSSKIKEADPLRVSALLGRGLISLGLFLEDLKLMSDGKERIAAALDIAQNHPDLLYAAALSEFAHGLYFSNPRRYSNAVTYHDKGIETDSTSLRNWHGLFQTYLSWGMSEGDSSLARRGEEAIARVCRLRPHSPIHLNEWGVCLLQTRQLERDLDVQQALVEEAILRFKQAYSIQEDHETLYNWGCALDQLGDLSGDEEDYEKAIELLSHVYEDNPHEPHVCYHLALALSHFGELTGNVESLYQAAELFNPLAEADLEDAVLWGDFGYTLLNLSELLHDPIQPSKSEELRREAEKRLLHAAEAGNEDANYHLACLYSLAGLVDISIHYLKRAETADALPPQEDLAHDEWLANVRETDLFKEFILG